MQNVFWISFLHGGVEWISANNNLKLFGEKKHKSNPAPLCIHTKTWRPISHPWKGSCCEVKLLDTKSKRWGVVGLFVFFLWAKECLRSHRNCLADEQSPVSVDRREKSTPKKITLECKVPPLKLYWKHF